MKKMLLTGIPVFFMCQLHAQQTAGTATYERTMHMQMHIVDDQQGEQMLPRTRSDKFTLDFGDNKSLYKHADEDLQTGEMDEGGNGVQIRMIAQGVDDISYCDFNTLQTVEQREMFGKKFIVTDSIHKLNWKLTGTTQTLLGHICQEAIAEKPTKHVSMNIDNGKMEQKETTDTVTITAWFTTDIPVPAGPEVEGQLPGLILSLDLGDGRTTYKALSINDKANVSDIKEPTKGKKMTAEEFKQETKKMLDEMQKNNRGGNRVIRIQN
jgi:GLPGLI family protein